MNTDAAIYVRISDDREGLELGTARQTEDARRLAEREGRTVPDDLVFPDNDLSASTRAKKVRPQWDRMIELIEVDDGVVSGFTGMFSAAQAWDGETLRAN